MLLAEAAQARSRAYAPYSGYRVGVALLAADGSVVYGCNVENASYGATICAERVALTAAVAQGKRDFVAMALVTENGGTPCGMCRQVLLELAPAITLYIGDATGNYSEISVDALLPYAFGPGSLTTQSSTLE
jgi:cytidine deaminase